MTQITVTADCHHIALLFNKLHLTYHIEII